MYNKKAFNAALKKKNLVVMLVVLISGIWVTGCKDAEWEQLKQAVLNRPRHVIHNTDGCDALYYPLELDATKENFIKQRLINVKGSKVNTISYCPLSSGFGYLTSRTEVGDQLLISSPSAKNKRNVTGELLELGTDPVKIAEEFCRDNGREFFISLRCNDTHDVAHRKDKPYFLFPPYKEKNPQFLIGSQEKRPSYGAWSAVDFTRQEVRKRFVAIAEELINNYNIDGLELDFCRHLQYFKSVAWGEDASDEELNMMTECIRQIRAIAEKTGKERNHPILISVRVPDSVGMCRAVGLDLDNWMQFGLVDIVIGGFYMRLNPWRTMVDLCHKYDVKFYPSMDESRIYKVEKGFNRNTQATDMARIASALTAGADGIYYFNRYGYKALHNMRGTLDDIRLENKRYFITYRYRYASSYINGGERFNNIKNLSPLTPCIIGGGKKSSFKLEFGDDFNMSKTNEIEADITVSLIADTGRNKDLQISINNHLLKQITSREKFIVYSADPEMFNLGLNDITISLPPGNSDKDIRWSEKVILKGDRLLVWKTQRPWRRLFTAYNYAESEKVVNGAYRISDTGTNINDMANLLYPLIDIDSDLKVKFQAKVEDSNDKLSTVFRIADGKNIEIITFQTNSIGLYFTKKEIIFNTSDKFHNYEAKMKNGQLVFSADGVTLFDIPLQMNADDPAGSLKNNTYNIPYMNTRSLLFGSLSGIGTGSVLWKNIRVMKSNDKVKIEDLKVDVKISQTSYLEKYNKVEPDWTLNFNVTNGVIPITGNIKNNYKKENLKIIKDDSGLDVLRMTHSDGYQNFEINNFDLVKGTGILLSEWKIKYLHGAENMSGFLVVLRPLNAEKEQLLCDIRISENRIITPWGIIELNKSIKNSWVIFRLAIDVEKAVARLWMNGDKIGDGRIKVIKSSSPGGFFGDGSGSVSGQAELEYFKLVVKGCLGRNGCFHN